MKFPTDGDGSLDGPFDEAQVRDPQCLRKHAAEPVRFRDRQYSLDGRRKRESTYVILFAKVFVPKELQTIKLYFSHTLGGEES